MMECIVVSAITALVVSAVYNKISAVHTFNVIDGYVREIIEMVKGLIRNTSIDK